ncbi:related to NAM9 - mitochondrial ribosomal protein, small subunit [Cephalotrichum gorgonifer]|uniref:Related to NAM9 - mitochondrial ribosomal protein, small subunit n=1 Tax=Cephalotrichum gorgonifer TaxID=2041049 RepID=A0AAE8MTC1_9PEZI|nr:related to NAM9 - mitochondrial ribosomal protein, small subunit [Cephalotrichum gorgonifer]
MRPAVKRYVLGRPSWNKYNLYNISKADPIVRTTTATFFQQKWAAKAMTRTYHGDHIPEKRWNRLFDRRLASVVEMPPEYLAAHDGSEQAEGRGSGREVDPNDPKAHSVTATSYSVLEEARQAQLARDDAQNASRARNQRPGTRSLRAAMRRPVQDMTPYMQMAFAPQERRLEVAMFRAMFASTPRQARQFCIHGAVKVNGKKMRYGSYMLNPGDLFEVDPDMVMLAAGKDKNQASLEAAVKKLQASKYAKAVADDEAVVESSKDAESEATETSEEKPEGEEVAAVEEEAPEEPELSSLPEAGREAEQRRRVKALVASAKTLLKESPDLNAKRKQELRAFVRASKAALGHKEDLAADDLMATLSSHLTRFKLDGKEVTDAAAKTDSSPAPTADAKNVEEVGSLSKSEAQALARLLRANEEDDENPVDNTKPYATPWEPRKYLKPLAFIPRYLEVNQNICAAVYLRNPVARIGLAEVPTPFSYDVNQLAYTWYLRRR